jgi:hypothetical protein
VVGVSFSELVAMLAMGFNVIPVATLTGHVRIVFSLGTQPQVLHIVAGWIVASMADDHPIRDVVNFHVIPVSPSNPMHKPLFAITGLDTIAVPISETMPFNAVTHQSVPLDKIFWNGVWRSSYKQGRSSYTGGRCQTPQRSDTWGNANYFSTSPS